jgi:putative addiction module component (TIGR02574 family)
MAIDFQQLLALPAAERLRLAELLWDSVGDAPRLDALPLTPMQAEELDRRLAEYPEDDAAGRPAEEVLAELNQRLWRGG